jgi:uncharacterized protein YciI
MLFIMLATDKPGHLHLRETHRAAHVAFLTAAGPMVRAAGRTLDGDGGAANGSFMICEADRASDVEAFLARDPFVINGLYDSWEIRPWHWVLGDGKPLDT